MKRQLFAALALSYALLSAYAVQLTPQAALARAKASAQSGVMKKTSGSLDVATPAYIGAGSGYCQYYVFNNANSQGYTIVAADDCVAPLLGYSTQGTFDPDNIPANMRAWLDSYQEQINWAITHSRTGSTPGAAVDETPQRLNIEPMVSTSWGQDAPFNSLCPDLSGQKCATGCVATAMAQIMYYHKWPERGVGTHSYKWNKTTLSADFGETAYRWDDMVDRYTSSATTAQKNAVATLMYHCGVSVDMNYGPSSGAQSAAPAYALINYFNYAPTATYYLRDYFGIVEWEQMIYDELAAGRPVMYDGVTAENAGHEFVCDGYQNGYFHINWGWNGMSDGYFRLTALDPESQGTGGGMSAYNYLQGATIGIRQPTATQDAVRELMVVATKPFYTATTDYTRADNIKLLTTEFFYLYAKGSVNVTPGVKFVDSMGEVTYGKGVKTLTMKGLTTPVYEIVISGSEFPESPGTYTMTPAVFDTATGQWSEIRVEVGRSTTFNVTIDGSAITINPPQSYAGQLTATNIQLATPLYNSVEFRLSGTVSVEGDEYLGDIKAALALSGTKTFVNWSPGLLVDVIASRPSEFDIIGKFNRKIEAGEYDLYIVDADGNVISEPLPVAYNGDAPGVTRIVVESIAPKSRTMPQNGIEITGTISCESGIYSGPLRVLLFEPNGTYATGFVTEPLWIEAGNKYDFSVKGSYLNGPTGLQYYTAVVYFNDNYLEPYAKFRLSKATLSSVDDGVAAASGLTRSASSITATGSAIEHIEVYTVAGVCLIATDGHGDDSVSVDISTLVPGLYVATVADSNGVKSYKFVKQ